MALDALRRIESHSVELPGDAAPSEPKPPLKARTGS